MPTFIVRQAGAEPRFAKVDFDECVIGRDPACTVVLPAPTVSRQHLVIRKYPGPQYVIDGVKPSNPVMINGAFVRERTLLKEGDELQIADFLVIFSLRDRAEDHYVKETAHYDGVCTTCRWTGRLGRANRNPRCPSCGAPITERKDDLSAAQARAASTSQGSTSYMAPVDMAKLHDQIRLKTKARLKARGAGGTGHPLNPAKPSTIGAPGKADLSAGGLVLGGGVSVAWEEDAWVARWQGLIPRMKLNGEGAKVARLKPGDTLTVGSTDFELLLA